MKPPRSPTLGPVGTKYVRNPLRARAGAAPSEPEPGLAGSVAEARWLTLWPALALTRWR